MGILLALAPFIPGIVTFLESKFGKKTGPTKLDTAVNMLLPLATSLAGAGVGNGPMPTKDQLAAKVSEVAGSLFPSGTTIGDNTPAGVLGFVNLSCPHCNTILGNF